VKGGKKTRGERCLIACFLKKKGREGKGLSRLFKKKKNSANEEKKNNGRMMKSER